MVNYEKEGDLEIHFADVGGYHQRHPDEPGSVELPGMRERKKVVGTCRRRPPRKVVLTKLV
jgi:hypothetical protein